MAACAQRIGKTHLQRMKIACVGVQQPALPFDHSGDPWMRMANMRDIVVGIQMRPAMLVIEIVPPAAQDLQRLPVGQFQVVPESLFARVCQRPWIGDRIGHAIRIQPKKVRRIGIEGSKEIQIISIGDTGPVMWRAACFVRQAVCQLEMQMWLPASIHIGCAKPADHLTGHNLVICLHAGNAGRIKVTAEAVELVTVTGIIVPQHNRAAIILMACPIDRDDDCPVKRGVDGRPAGAKRSIPIWMVRRPSTALAPVR